MSHFPKRAAALAVAASLLAAGPATPASASKVATPHLYGSTALHTIGDPRVFYRATGVLPASGYALRLVRPTSQHRTRCVAYLAGPRRASGTERFYGSVPSAIYCGGAPGKSQPISPGFYNVEVCVPATTYGACRADATILRQRVRVRP